MVLLENPLPLFWCWNWFHGFFGALIFGVEAIWLAPSPVLPSTAATAEPDAIADEVAADAKPDVIDDEAAATARPDVIDDEVAAVAEPDVVDDALVIGPAAELSATAAAELRQSCCTLANLRARL